LFLPPGAPLVEIRPRPPQAPATQLAERPARYPPTLPLAVVIDEQSASAAEVLLARGKDVEFTGITISRCQDGRIVEEWEITDTVGLLGQIGALPAMAQS